MMGSSRTDFGLNRYKEALGRRMKAVFQVKKVLSCELDGGFILAGQIAMETGDVEVLLDVISELPRMFRDPNLRSAHPLELLFVGRKFRGIIPSPVASDVSFDFGRYRLRFIPERGEVILDIGCLGPESWDLPEDAHLSIEEQLENAERIARGARFS